MTGRCLSQEGQHFPSQGIGNNLGNGSGWFGKFAKFNGKTTHIRGYKAWEHWHFCGVPNFYDFLRFSAVFDIPDGCVDLWGGMLFFFFFADVLRDN